MIRLHDLHEPRWLDLPRGVRVQARIHDPVADMAGLAAWRAARQAGASDAEVELDELVAVARTAVVAWEGVIEDDGTPTACTPENVELLLRRLGGAALRFSFAYYAARLPLDAEKNGSAGSPTGITAPEPAPSSAVPA